MEKFYIVENKEYIKEIEDFDKNKKDRIEFMKKFFADKGISREQYWICGDGFYNKPFEDEKKNTIRLWIEDCEENNSKFGKELLKPKAIFSNSDVLMRSFRANSKTLKEFQNLCIENKIVINLFPIQVGDYFKELHFGGFSSSRFVYDGKYYLRISTSNYDEITPDDGFIEIAGSMYFSALEQVEKANEM